LQAALEAVRAHPVRVGVAGDDRRHAHLLHHAPVRRADVGAAGAVAMTEHLAGVIAEALALFVILYAGALKPILVSLARMGHRGMLDGVTTAACGLLDVLYFYDRVARRTAAYFRAYAAADAGRSEAAVLAVEQALLHAREQSPSVCHWSTV